MNAANTNVSTRSGTQSGDGGLQKGLIGFMLGHEQFTVPELVEIGAAAAQSGFGLLAASDHFQPWQVNEGHAGQVWVTLAALSNRATEPWMGTTVTCPILRYHPAVVAQTFASLSLLHPGRIFLGVGSGEALNEQAATGEWPGWEERWERLIEAIAIIRALWTGQTVAHKGKYYSVNAKLYDPPPRPIPLLIAANNRKSMPLAGRHGDGLITDSQSWKQYKAEWEAGAREVGKNPADMPVLVESFAVVGDESEARKAAELWRFIPKAFKGMHDIPDPAAIQHEATLEIPIEEVIGGWTVGTDPDIHIRAIRKLFDSGVTIVNIHTGQQDQKRAIEFYGSKVLPHFARQH
ncbi:MAG TPA: TIGR03557 family F420-dependent LLM class oxidoreductase [Micropepsaceae bacterium]|nr:TIGR03557 family F420-dependent LLM class oxidoreductase [Micropepsaceae bacterium]